MSVCLGHVFFFIFFSPILLWKNTCEPCFICCNGSLSALGTKKFLIELCLVPIQIWDNCIQIYFCGDPKSAILNVFISYRKRINSGLKYKEKKYSNNPVTEIIQKPFSKNEPPAIKHNYFSFSNLKVLLISLIVFRLMTPLFTSKQTRNSLPCDWLLLRAV